MGKLAPCLTEARCSKACAILRLLADVLISKPVLQQLLLTCAHDTFGIFSMFVTSVRTGVQRERGNWPAASAPLFSFPPTEKGGKRARNCPTNENFT